MDKLYKAVGMAILTVAAVGLILPLSVLFGWIAGFIVKMFAGHLIADGINLLFNTSRFTSEHIPMVCATLSILCAYFRTSVRHDKD